MWSEHRNIIMKICLWIFLVTNHSRFEAKRMMDDNARYVQPIIMQYLITSIQTWFFLQNSSWGIDFYKYISCHVAKLFFVSLPLRHAQFTKEQSCSFISSWVNLYSAFMLPLSTIVSFGLEVLDILAKFFFKIKQGT